MSIADVVVILFLEQELTNNIKGFSRETKAKDLAVDFEK